MLNYIMFILLLALTWPCQAKPLEQFAEKFKACDEAILKKWQPHKALSSKDQGGLFEVCNKEYKNDCSYRIDLLRKVEADFATTMGNLGIWPLAVDSYECGNFIALVQEKELDDIGAEGFELKDFAEMIIELLHTTLNNAINLKKVVPENLLLISRGDGVSVRLSKSAIEGAKFLPDLYGVIPDKIEKILVGQIVELTKHLATSSTQSDNLKHYSPSKYKKLLSEFYQSMATIPKYGGFFRDNAARKRIAKLLREKIPQ